MDPEVRSMVNGVHGPLLTALAARGDYHDAAAVELFRSGAPLVGAIAASGTCSRKLHGLPFVLCLTLQDVAQRS